MNCPYGVRSQQIERQITPTHPSPLEASGSEEPLARRGEGERGGYGAFKETF
jgi:hypothetical protein